MAAARLHGYDGWDHVGTPVTLGGLRAPDPELHELVTPYKLVEYEIEPDSAGPGRWRGGFGVRYTFSVEGDGIACANFGSGARDFTAPLGIHEGQGAAPHLMTLEHADGSREEIDGNRMYTLKQGDTMTIVSSGGGGFGDPKQRAPEAVLRDVRNGPGVRRFGAGTIRASQSSTTARRSATVLSRRRPRCCAPRSHYSWP